MSCSEIDSMMERERLFLSQSDHRSVSSVLTALTVLTLAGCGNGKYLHINKEVFKLGCDVCRPLVDFAWSQGHEVQMCDGLQLPYRDGCFDAVLSIAGNGQRHTQLGGVGGVGGGLLTPLCSAANHSLHIHEAQLRQLLHI